jgi:hypothetical protein
MSQHELSFRQAFLKMKNDYVGVFVQNISFIEFVGYISSLFGELKV